MPIPAPAWYAHSKPCPECHEEHTRCADHAQGGDPCRKPAMKGSWKCVSHKGRALRELSPVPDRDTEQLIETYASVGPMLEAAHGHTSGMDFAESIQDGLNRTNAMVVMLQMLISRLAAKADWTGDWVEGQKPYYAVDVRKEGLIGPDDKGNLGTHPWVVLYGEWVSRQVQFAKAAADLGIAERNVRVAEAQTSIMAEAMLGLLSDFGIDIDDPDNMPIIQQRLLALDTTVIELDPPALTAAATSS